MVKNPLKNWKKMKGANTLEKRINALLSDHYISSKEVPSDECLSYAEAISKWVKKGVKEEVMEEKIAAMLYKSFYTGSNGSGKTVVYKKDKYLRINIKALLTLIWVFKS